MTSLRELGIKYGTDKVNHGFCDIYDDIFGSIRNEVVNILEIGVYFGASIMMWKEYFPNGTIYGMDTFEGLQGNGNKFENAKKFYDEWEINKIDSNLSDRIELYVNDQSKEESIMSFVNKMKKKGIMFDIILDDGSHLMRDQQISLGYLFELVKPGGYYVIEDVHTSLGDYDTLPDLSNTTLKMIKRFNECGKLSSQYMDLSKIEKEIGKMELYIVKNVYESMTCIINKKYKI